MSAANFVEVAIVIDVSRDHVASRRFDDRVNEAQLIIELVSEVQARIAREAYRDFGRGSGHPARLNFGACYRPPQQARLQPVWRAAAVGRMQSASFAYVARGLRRAPSATGTTETADCIRPTLADAARAPRRPVRRRVQLQHPPPQLRRLTRMETVRSLFLTNTRRSCILLRFA
jgi:ribonuclease VapC